MKSPADFVVKLSYFNQGDDFASHLKMNNNDAVGALQSHAAALREDAHTLSRLAHFLEALPVDKRAEAHVSGNTHGITVTLPPSLHAVFEKLHLSGHISMMDTDYIPG